MLVREWVIAGILVSAYLFLAVFNPLFIRINMYVRQYVLLTRPLVLRPLMVLTHQYNDVLFLSLQLIALSLLMGFYWHDWRRAMVLTSAMFIQTTALTATKQITAAARPPQDISHVKMRSGSYPSGHSAASLTFALLVPTVLVNYLPFACIFWIRLYLLFVAAITAYGRLFLDVHWFSDIIGAWLLSPVTWIFANAFLRNKL